MRNIILQRNQLVIAMSVLVTPGSLCFHCRVNFDFLWHGWFYLSGIHTDMLTCIHIYVHSC